MKIISLFPHENLSQIVPPILHINLGIVLKLYNLLLEFIMGLDKCEGGYVFDNDLTKSRV